MRTNKVVSLLKMPSQKKTEKKAESHTNPQGMSAGYGIGRRLVNVVSKLMHLFNVVCFAAKNADYSELGTSNKTKNQQLPISNTRLRRSSLFKKLLPLAERKRVNAIPSKQNTPMRQD